ncbi:MAG: DoxX family protein [Candidatus Eremiobacteraeota bacterium]|nr:DoxX family protein [Candidatus Eremiobacteraeota bacterium]
MQKNGVLVDTALLASRTILGMSIGAHGAQKYFGWFDGPGLEGTARVMDGVGFRPPEQFAAATALGEMSSGTLLTLGALGPIGPAVMLSIMLVASETVHKKNGYFAQDGGIELNVVYSAAALLLANVGYGNFSVDKVTGFSKLHKPWVAWLAVAGGIGAGLSILSLRAPQARSAPEMASYGAMDNTPPPPEADAG